MKKLIVVALCVLCVCQASLLGQETTGRINGTVFDSQGAVVSNAKVAVTNPSTGFVRTTLSDNTGSYSLPLLPPGTYNMRVEAPRFAPQEQKGIALLVGQTLTVDQQLKPGGGQ